MATLGAFWIYWIWFSTFVTSQDPVDTEGRAPLPDTPYKKWSDLYTYTDSCSEKSDVLDGAFSDLPILVGQDQLHAAHATTD